MLHRYGLGEEHLSSLTVRPATGGLLRRQPRRDAHLAFLSQMLHTV